METKNNDIKEQIQTMREMILNFISAISGSRIKTLFTNSNIPDNIEDSGDFLKSILYKSQIQIDGQVNEVLHSARILYDSNRQMDALKILFNIFAELQSLDDADMQLRYSGFILNELKYYENPETCDINKGGYSSGSGFCCV